jgi:PLP dependent protein
MASLITRYQKTLSEIRLAAEEAKRNPSDVALIAVSKTHPFESILALYEAGQRDFGENYVQELLEKVKKAELLGLKDIRWHFIGHLQTNKVKLLLPHIYLLHTLDRVSLLEELVKRADGARVRALIEVNIDDEESKSGVKPSDVESLIQQIASHPKGIDLRGWMAIPKPGSEVENRNSFARLRALSETYRSQVGGTLSMGMSSDFKIAIQEGSNFVRVGTALFGART